MSEKCFCHIKDIDGNKYAVKDATARKSLADLNEILASKFATFERQIKALDMAIDGLDDINNGESTIDLTDITNAITTLETSINGLDDSIKTLEDTVNTQEEARKTLEVTVREQGDKIVELEENKNSSLEDIVNQHTNSINSIEDYINSISLKKLCIHTVKVDVNTYNYDGSQDYTKPYGNLVIKIINWNDMEILNYETLRAHKDQFIDISGIINVGDQPDSNYLIKNIDFGDLTGDKYKLIIRYQTSIGYDLSQFTLELEPEEYLLRITDTVTEI